MKRFSIIRVVLSRRSNGKAYVERIGLPISDKITYKVKELLSSQNFAEETIFRDDTMIVINPTVSAIQQAFNIHIVFDESSRFFNLHLLLQAVYDTLLINLLRNNIERGSVVSNTKRLNKVIESLLRNNNIDIDNIKI